jgi:hypothetical protein
MSDLEEIHAEKQAAMREAYAEWQPVAVQSERLRQAYLERRADLDRFEREHPEIAMGAQRAG